MSPYLHGAFPREKTTFPMKKLKHGGCAAGARCVSTAEPCAPTAQPQPWQNWLHSGATKPGFLTLHRLRVGAGIMHHMLSLYSTRTRPRSAQSLGIESELHLAETQANVLAASHCSSASIPLRSRRLWRLWRRQGLQRWNRADIPQTGKRNYYGSTTCLCQRWKSCFQ